MGGQLVPMKEALQLAKETECLFPGEDNWAACSNPDDDWIQLGNEVHSYGKSHFYGGG